MSKQHQKDEDQNREELTGRSGRALWDGGGRVGGRHAHSGWHNRHWWSERRRRLLGNGGCRSWRGSDGSLRDGGWWPHSGG